VVEPERLVFTSVAWDKNRNPLFEVLNTIAFAEQGGKTRLTCAVVVKATAAAAPHPAGLRVGWSQSLDRLATEMELRARNPWHPPSRASSKCRRTSHTSKPP
jgi:uncharacterized protein YndB with AHSA1/START domain